MKKTRIVPFDITKAKNGAKVITRAGNPIRIKHFNGKIKPYTVVASIEEYGIERTLSFTELGQHDKCRRSKYDLFIEEEVENDYKNQDESIRKALISYFQNFPYNSLEDAGIDAKDAIAWLKGQGEQETLCDKCKKLQPSHSCQDITALGRCAVEHEQKPTPSLKINPDKWYVCKCLVSSKDGSNMFIQGTYHLGKDILAYGLEIEPEEYSIYFRPWSIIDAKPGDILQSSRLDYKGIHYDSIFIFDSLSIWESFSLDDSDRVVAFDYCYLNVYSDKMEFGVQGPDCVVEVDTITPVTKEQRNLLFQKIKEEGYEWDSDKKELHKIEEVKKRRMTHQELSWWLRDCPEEHREYSFCDDEGVRYFHTYRKDSADKEVEKEYRIRRNGGEWEEPLIEE